MTAQQTALEMPEHLRKTQLIVVNTHHQKAVKGVKAKSVQSYVKRRYEIKHYKTFKNEDFQIVSIIHQIQTAHFEKKITHIPHIPSSHQVLTANMLASNRLTAISRADDVP